MIYSKYFTSNDIELILSKENLFTFKYHVVITFPNIVNIDDFIQVLYKNLDTGNFFLFCWHCNTNRKYKKSSNPHPRRKHLHIILFTNSKYDYFKYDTKITDIYDLFGLLEYIHDGHHIIKNRYFKDKSNVFRELLRNLRISNK